MKAQSEFEAGSPEQYGFGVGIMKEIKVCVRCGSSESAASYTCSQCGARLPGQTLYQRYQQMHRRCPACDTILTERMKFCPHCGVNLEKEKEDG